MQIETFKKYNNTPISISCEQVQNSPGTWKSTKVSIYRDGNLIGEYLRNYPNFSQHTFYPFCLNNEWYALYSADYTAIRVMKLHSDRIEDWCGEDSNPDGFCPTEIFVPQYIHSRHSLNVQGNDNTYDAFYVDCDIAADEFEAEIESDDFLSLQHCNFGFLAGCYWGDDNIWKLRYIDLSRICEKILTITDKFGYWSLPGNLTLKECIKMANWEPGHDWVCLTRAENINLTTDERC